MWGFRKGWVGGRRKLAARLPRPCLATHAENSSFCRGELGATCSLSAGTALSARGHVPGKEGPRCP